VNIALVGAGRVGTAVAYLLKQAGHRVVGVASRSKTSAADAAHRLDSTAVPLSELPTAEVVLLGVGDAAIQTVSETIAEGIETGSYVCHFAGSFGTAPLSAALDAGARACAIHPVQACPSVDAGIARLPGSAWGVTCSDADAEAAMNALIAQDLHGTPVSVPEEVRPIWHAAAVMTSNAIAALLARAERVLDAIDVKEPARVLGPLALGTFANAMEGGGGASALTGPVVRGDVQTVKRHLESFERLSPVHRTAYLEATILIFAAASELGRIDRDAAQRMVDVLQEALRRARS